MTTRLLLPPETVQAWCVDLLLTDQEYTMAKSILSADEWQRYHQKRADLARSAVASRYYLRTLLSRYLDIPAEDLHFFYGDKGKPSIEASFELEFNVTHKDQKAIMVFSRKSVGVDLENTQVRDFLGLAKRYFAPTEYDLFMKTSIAEQPDLFYRIWTQKEAFIKAHGKSVFSDLSRFTVDPSEPGGLLTWQDGNINDWWCRCWRLTPEYWCAIMSRAPITHLTLQISLAGKSISL
jgi:4'-phosphopantetheinyl transferase